MKIGGGLLKKSGLTELKIGGNPDLVASIQNTLADLSARVVLV